ncbi:MAG: DUF3592 domain-containing protein [Gammaproteobacteria bacterium]|nr:DUF3592 domain-containing protein [Gammaproteobacteria bacterium]
MISGWVFFGLGFMFLLSLVVIQFLSRPWTLFPDLPLDRDGVAAVGTVKTLVKKSNSRSPDSDIYRLDFSFATLEGETRNGYCYTKLPQVQPGDAVEVEYCPENPSLARIKGTSAAGIQFWLFPFPSAMAVAGLVLLISAFRGIGRNRRVLAQGEVSLGSITDVSLKKSIKVNKISPWQLVYRFRTARGAMGQGQTLVFPDSRDYRSPPCQSGAACVVVYDGEDPRNNTLVFDGDFGG